MAISVELQHPPIFPDKLKVFDTFLYAELSSQVMEPTLTEDLAGMCIEAWKRPLKERVNPRRFVIANGQVLDPVSQKYVWEGWSYSTLLDQKQSRGAKVFWEAVVKNKNAAVISLSPSGGDSPYEEGRVNTAFRNGDDVEFYGIASHLTREQCMQYAWRLREFSQVSAPFKSPDDLREIAFILMVPDGQSPKEFLRDNFPLDSDVWQEILEGKPWEIKEIAIKDARETVKEVLPSLAGARSQRDFIVAGARMERMMAERGWELSKLACPGIFNSELLRMLGLPQIKDAFGNVRETSWEDYKHTLGNCIRCGAKNTEIGPCKWCKSCSE